MTDHTIDAQISEAKRELGLRYGVYKKRVAYGSMTQEQADDQIALQRAIIASLEKLKRLAEAPGVLF